MSDREEEICGDDEISLPKVPDLVARDSIVGTRGERTESTSVRWLVVARGETTTARGDPVPSVPGNQSIVVEV